MAAAFLSHYRLLGLLGVGGMGEVYRAEDTRLRREVAIKILHPEAAASREWLSRFRREARLASALQHPNICTIHELGEHDGQSFIVMERLEGVTVRDLLEHGPIPPGRVIAYAKQVAEALDAAHKRGIIHRDIKPANLFVTDGDHVKVVDFGLARLAGDEPPGGPMSGLLPAPAIVNTDVPVAAAREAIQAAQATQERRPHEASVGVPRALHLTQTGMAMGTVFYMSPEQARGDALDARTDLFSLGSVLYEMVTGRRAFEGDDIAQILGKITHGVFVPPRALNAAVPRSLDAIIVKLLAADPRQRYQRAADLLTDLQRADAPSGATPRPADEAARPVVGRRVLIWRRVGIGVSALLVAGSVGYAWYTRRAPALTDRDSIVIGMFENGTGNSVFDDTLVTALKVQLGQSPFLDIVSDQRIGETLRLMGRPADQPLTHDVARETCQRMGVKAMIDGRIAPLGTHYVLTLVATDCQTGETLARTQGEATSSEAVLSELGSVAAQMRTTLGESLPSLARFDVPNATTPSLAALKAYALGLEERRRGRELESLAFLNQAIELDPDFAQAHATLSTVYGALGEFERSEKHAREAFEHQDRVSERERLFIRYQYHDRVTGNQDAVTETLQVWQAAYPRDFVPSNALSVVFNRLGQYERAVTAATEALNRSPGHPFAVSNLAVAYRGLGRYEEARRAADDAVKADVATSPTRRLLYQLAVLANDSSASQHLAWARGRSREFDLIAAQAQIAMFEGRWREGETLYRRAAELAIARGLRGVAAGQFAHLAWLEALYRPGPDLGGRVERTLALGRDDEGAVASPRLRAAAALGLAGRREQALAIVAEAERRYAQSTFVRTALAPSARAAVALQARRGADAVSALDAARATEIGGLGALVPLFLRAEALRQEGLLTNAIDEYERLLRHRGTDPFAPMIPLGHLGLARARVAAGDVAGARRSYEAALAIWHKADDDFPPRRAAKAEYDGLAPTPGASTQP